MGCNADVLENLFFHAVGVCCGHEWLPEPRDTEQVWNIKTRKVKIFPPIIATYQ
jgi:hypothetical protein